jgi:hypothetical protein
VMERLDVESFHGDHSDCFGDESDWCLLVVCGSAGWAFGIRFGYDGREQLLGHELSWNAFVTFRSIHLHREDLQ